MTKFYVVKGGETQMPNEIFAMIQKANPDFKPEGKKEVALKPEDKQNVLKAMGSMIEVLPGLPLDVRNAYLTITQTLSIALDPQEADAASGGMDGQMMAMESVKKSVEEVSGLLKGADEVMKQAKLTIEAQATEIKTLKETVVKSDTALGVLTKAIEALTAKVTLSEARLEVVEKSAGKPKSIPADEQPAKKDEVAKQKDEGTWKGIVPDAVLAGKVE